MPSRYNDSARKLNLLCVLGLNTFRSIRYLLCLPCYTSKENAYCGLVFQTVLAFQDYCLQTEIDYIHDCTRVTTLLERQKINDNLNDQLIILRNKNPSRQNPANHPHLKGYTSIKYHPRHAYLPG